MSSNVNYSFVNKSDSDSTIVFRSSVESFGLDHVTDKDISSFYHNFSNYLHFDTGLLPVDGSGVLSIRTAGPFTQVAYQHKPGMYYINWGDYEGDYSAVKYYIAQPYRIVIGDFFNGNIYGARTFYSPIPITYPSAPLYHVNLPNINCNGYRGNGVGWICLYHSEDVSSYPFSEKVVKLIDRCSGTEAYNDQNMNETDGPRFYQKRGKPSHLYDPYQWQSYSEKNGYEWTLDPDLWIPVLVKDIDNQDRHYEDGEPLTFVKALLGNYQAYYTDNNIPKPFNAISRSDLTLEASSITSWFKQAYNQSSVSSFNQDIYQNIETVRETTSITVQKSFDDEEDEEETICCDNCGTDVSPGDLISIYDYNHDVKLSSHSASFCGECVSDYGVYINHLDLYYHEGSSDVYYSDILEESFVLPLWDEKVQCSDCSAYHPYKVSSGVYPHHLPIWKSSVNDSSICSNCMHTLYNTSSCSTLYCYSSIPDLSSNQALTDQNKYDLKSIHNPISKVTSYHCNSCYECSNPFTIIQANHSEDPSYDLGGVALCLCGNSDFYDSFSSYIFSFDSYILNKHTDVNTVQASVKLSNYISQYNYSTYSSFLPEDIPNFYTFRVNALCSICILTLNADSNTKMEHINFLSSKFKNLVSHSVESNQKLDDIYGICFTPDSPIPTSLLNHLS